MGLGVFEAHEETVKWGRLLKGYAFFVRRALEVAFVGLRVGPI
jgi:hypothetical protein